MLSRLPEYLYYLTAENNMRNTKSEMNMSRSTDTTKYFSYTTDQILVPYQLNKHIRY
jgi:hypothetical protein